MQDYPWWNETQRKLMEDVHTFTNEVLLPLRGKMRL